MGLLMICLVSPLRLLAPCLLLPKIANVARIMKNALPKNAKISKDAKEIVQECVSEFISFITSEAAEKCLLDKRKTVGGEDILYAMSSLGFGDYATVLQIYLAKLREQTLATAAARRGSVSQGGDAALDEEGVYDDDDGELDEEAYA
ncbi:hypothetical protein DL93DRAFT_2075574 [Clavulina sp. PMI_390]|nr:hypothetical protein DL93DRAFT_2075574 [Clavulina sp. PMI_390]